MEFELFGSGAHSSLTAESGVALGIAAFFVVVLLYSAWKAFRGGAERLYWRVGAAFNWGAVMGLIAFDSQPVTVDASGELHEQFAMVGISLIAAAVGSLVTMIGVANAAYRRMTSKTQPRSIDAS